MLRELLGQDRIPGVLRHARAEFVAQGVPHDALVSPEVQPRELEQPVPLEVQLLKSGRRPEHVRVGIVLQLVASYAERGDETVSPA